jgi:hypothetical protein
MKDGQGEREVDRKRERERGPYSIVWWFGEVFPT